MNQTSICLDPHHKIRMKLILSNLFKPSSDSFADRSKAVILLCLFFVFVGHTV